MIVTGLIVTGMVVNDMVDTDMVVPIMIVIFLVVTANADFTYCSFPTTTSTSEYPGQFSELPTRLYLKMYNIKKSHDTVPLKREIV